MSGAGSSATGRDWQYLSPFGVGQPGSPAAGNAGPAAGASAGGVLYRDELDMRRAQNRLGSARTPGSQWPDGYLGTAIKSRRQDRMLNQTGVRVTQKAYQRGVHKGERIDPADYMWPDDFHPMSGLHAQAEGVQWTATSIPVETHLTAQGKPLPRGSTSLVEINPYGPKQGMKSLRPNWT